MSYYIDIQNASDAPLPVSEANITKYAEMALTSRCTDGELTIRLVDTDEMVYLNETFRKKTGPTNVLSFPSSLPEGVVLDAPLLGDIIICPAVLAQECIEQNKTLEEHWALITIHGVLHLLGYDHINDEDAQVMQGIEIQLLETIGFKNPYPGEDH